MDCYDDPHRYDDIINLPHPEPKTRPRMSPEKRAAQFLGFMALEGYKESIEEVSRYVEPRRDLDELEKQRLDAKLGVLAKSLALRPEITVTYFCKDPRKRGGEYISHTGIVKRIDRTKGRLDFEDGLSIAAKEVSELEGTVFEELEL